MEYDDDEDEEEEEENEEYNDEYNDENKDEDYNLTKNNPAAHISDEDEDVYGVKEDY